MNPVQSQYESMQSRETSAGYPQHLRPSEDLTEYLRAYAREKPEVVALWCFGIGFVLGWKLKPW
jgi:hypothetical protein